MIKVRAFGARAWVILALLLSMSFGREDTVHPDYFPEIVEAVLRREGGWNPEDSGGSNFGITVETLRIHGPRAGLPKCSDCAVALRRLSPNTAKAIYRVLWEDFHGPEIRDPRAADMAFDFYVNSGWLGVVGLQIVLGRVGYPVQEDGVMGKETIAAVNRADAITLYRALRDYREVFYRQAATIYGKERYLQGWLNRIHCF